MTSRGSHACRTPITVESIAVGISATIDRTRAANAAKRPWRPRGVPTPNRFRIARFRVNSGTPRRPRDSARECPAVRASARCASRPSRGNSDIPDRAKCARIAALRDWLERGSCGNGSSISAGGSSASSLAISSSMSPVENPMPPSESSLRRCSRILASADSSHSANSPNARRDEHDSPAEWRNDSEPREVQRHPAAARLPTNCWPANAPG